MKMLKATLGLITGVLAYAVISLISFNAFNQYYTWQSQLWIVSALVVLALVALLILAAHRYRIFGIYSGIGLVATTLLPPFTTFTMSATEDVLNVDAFGYGAVSILGPAIGVAVIMVAVLARNPRIAT